MSRRFVARFVGALRPAPAAQAPRIVSGRAALAAVAGVAIANDPPKQPHAGRPPGRAPGKPGGDR